MKKAILVYSKSIKRLENRFNIKLGKNAKVSSAKKGLRFSVKKPSSGQYFVDYDGLGLA